MLQPVLVCLRQQVSDLYLCLIHAITVKEQKVHELICHYVGNLLLFTIGTKREGYVFNSLRGEKHTDKWICSARHLEYCFLPLFKMFASSSALISARKYVYKLQVMERLLWEEVARNGLVRKGTGIILLLLLAVTDRRGWMSGRIREEGSKIHHLSTKAVSPSRWQ